MSVDLSFESGRTMTFSNRSWRNVIELAEAKGFRWPLESNGEEKEILSAAEAAALADAIERVLGFGAADEVAIRVSQELARLLIVPSSSPMFSNDPIKVSADSIEQWRGFAERARLGGFSLSF